MASLSLAARRLTASSSRVGGLPRPRVFAGSVQFGRSVADSSKATVAVIPGPNGRSSHSAGSAAASAGRTSQNASSLRQWVLGISAAGAVVFLLNDEEKSKAHAMAGPNEYAGGMFGGEAHAADVTAESMKAGGPINKQRDKNPGKFDELNKNSRETLNIDTFDGFKLDAAVNMCAAPHKQFFHGQHLSLGSQQAPEGSYEFSTGFVSMGDNQNEGTVLNGRMDSGSGRMQGGIRTLAESGFAHNLTFAAGPDGFGNLSHETAYKGSDWTLVLKYASEPYLSMSYLQTVHPQVALGADFGFLVERGLPLVTFAGRFNTADRKEEYTAALSTVNTLNLAFNRRVSESISVASDLTVAPNGSLVQVGMQHKFRSATARGTIDTTLKTAGTLEVALAPTARLVFSAEANAYKDEYTAGFGMQIEV